MDTSKHALPELFAQLGLQADDEGIRAFIDLHRPLAAHLKLHQAPWWQPAQAAFLKEAFDQDAEWAEAADELDALLRHRELEDVYYD
jgi:hypothetical protein